jgi:hypothetical protein
LGLSPTILNDSASLSGGYSPTGTITFTLYDGATQVDSETATVTGNGMYSTTTGYTVPATGAGDYTWDASYGGDGNNNDGNTAVQPVTVSAPTTFSISGEVFSDANANGVLDSGEAGIQGVLVYIDLNNDKVFEPGDPNVLTDTNGDYSFTGLLPSDTTANPPFYLVRQTNLPSGYYQTSPAPGTGDHVTVTDANVINVNFGDHLNHPPVANPDSASTMPDKSVTANVLANDTDADHDALTIASITTPPANGKGEHCQ